MTQCNEYPHLIKRKMQKANYFRISLKKSFWTFINVLPIIVGMLLLTSLVVTLFPEKGYISLFGNSNIFDCLFAATVGSIAVGHPVVSYLLGAEMLERNVGLIAITAFLVTWVSVGIVQIPAEAMMLGTRFAVYRNIVCFITAIIISFLTVSTLRLLGAI